MKHHNKKKYFKHSNLNIDVGEHCMVLTNTRVGKTKLLSLLYQDDMLACEKNSPPAQHHEVFLFSSLDQFAKYNPYERVQKKPDEK